MWRHLLLFTITTGQELVYKYNVSCDNATNTLVKDERAADRMATGSESGWNRAAAGSRITCELI